MKEKLPTEPFYPRHASGSTPMLPSELEAYKERKETAAPAKCVSWEHPYMCGCRSVVR